MKHTPGPWQIRYPSGIDYLIRSESGLIVEGKFPSGDIQNMDEGQDEWYANANIIAAAPIMYEFIFKLASTGNDEAKQILNNINE